MIPFLLVGLATADIIMPSPPPRVAGAVDPAPPVLDEPEVAPAAWVAVPIGLGLAVAGGVLLIARRRRS